MTELLVNNVARLTLVPTAAGPAVASGARDHDPIPLFAVAEITRSPRPLEVLTSLSSVLANAGYRSLIEVVEPGGVSFRINHPRPEHEAVTWGDLAVLLEAEDALECDGRLIGVAFHGPTVPGSTEYAFVGAMRVSRPDASADAGLGWVGPNDVQVVRALVDHAVAVVTAERLRIELEEQRRRVENLELALTSNREIGVALGIIMATTRCSAEDAFDLLRSVSQNSNRKIRDVAAELAYTGELPKVPRARTGSAVRRPAPPI